MAGHGLLSFSEDNRIKRHNRVVQAFKHAVVRAGWYNMEEPVITDEQGAGGNPI